MITLNLRQAIYQRVQDKSNDELYEVIRDSLDHDERTLPGLGVLFEVIWKNIDQELQTELVSVLKDHLPVVQMERVTPKPRSKPRSPVQ